MKKGDIVIIAAALVLAASVSLFFLFSGKTGTTVTISQNNSIVYEGKLSESRTVDLESNIIKIENGKVWVENADCSNQICVNHKPIQKAKESIVCLPNKVLIEIK